MQQDLTDREWRTLQTAPLWVLSALAGRQSRFIPLELAAFWRAIDATASGAVGLANRVLISLSDGFAGRLADYEHEERSVVCGLWDVMAILNRLDIAVSAEFTTALLDVGERFSRARGSFGQVISREDGQTLQLLAALLDVEPALTFDRDAFA